MHIHEYQAKQILKAYNINIADGIFASTAEQAYQAAKQLTHTNSAQSLTPQTTSVVVKAQVHCGGRGKAGGIKIANSAENAKQIAHNMLGMRIITPQTSKEGKIVRKLYIEKGVNIQKEMYLSILLDRAQACWIIVASNEGGVNIEEVATTTPEKIIKVSVSTITGLQDYHIRQLIFFLGIKNQKDFTSLIRNLMRASIEKDILQLEINPLILTTDDQYMPLDAKMEFDDNSLFRQKDVAAMYDDTESSPLESRAKHYDLNYIKMTGSVGCMVNGAGLAMATMDIIDIYKGSPANFLDVGGSATEEKVQTGFEIINSDANVKVILVNIFGGIMKCDVIARGIVNATESLSLSKPIVVRLEGTNAEIARQILNTAKITIHTAHNLDEAAKLAVRLSLQ